MNPLVSTQRAVPTPSLAVCQWQSTPAHLSAPGWQRAAPDCSREGAALPVGTHGPPAADPADPPPWHGLQGATSRRPGLLASSVGDRQPTAVYRTRSQLFSSPPLTWPAASPVISGSPLPSHAASWPPARAPCPPSASRDSRVREEEGKGYQDEQASSHRRHLSGCHAVC